MRALQFLGLSTLTAALVIGFANPADVAAQVPNKQQLKEIVKAQKKKALQEKKAEAAKLAAAEEQAKADALAKEEADRKAKAEAATKAEAAKPRMVPANATPAALATLIDEQIDRTMAAAKVTPSPLASDAEFLRRAALDLTGVIPTADRARTFLDSTDPNKREKLIDELLASEQYGKHAADYWQARFFPRDSDNRFVLREPFVKWLADEFNANTPWDRFATDIVAGSGTVEKNAGVTFFLANRTIDKITDTISENLLGIQLECAQCHNHPFTGWKQTEYWGMAAFFSKVSPDKPKNGNKGGDNTQIGVQEGVNKTKAKDFFPESAKTVPAKFLGGPEPKLADREPFRPTFAKWLTAPENPYFAKAAVNRTWSFLFGEGFVNPIDDMHEGNPASHPELLNELARRFGTGGFDMKNLVKGICLSHAYQRSSKATAGNDESEEQFFAHQMVKVMTPEQLYDSITLVIGPGANDAKKRPGNGQKGNANGPREQFVQFFLAGSDQLSRTEYEAGIPQALRMMNSRFVGGNPNTGRQIAAGATGEAAIEKLYLATLSRRPTADETARLTAFLKTAATPTEGYADILWALLNSTEFTSVR